MYGHVNEVQNAMAFCYRGSLLRWDFHRFDAIIRHNRLPYNVCIFHIWISQCARAFRIQTRIGIFIATVQNGKQGAARLKPQQTLFCVYLCNAAMKLKGDKLMKPKYSVVGTSKQKSRLSQADRRVDHVCV